MPPKKGCKKPDGAGRKKGTPNKRSWEIVRVLHKAGFDPAAKLIQLTLDAEEDYLKNRKNDLGPGYLATASRNCAELCKFVYPTRKAVDVTSDGEKIFESLSQALATIADEIEANSNGGENPSS